MLPKFKRFDWRIVYYAKIKIGSKNMTPCRSHFLPFLISSIFFFSISEVAPVRLASLRAERARNHYQGSKALIQNREIENSGMKTHLGDDINKITTRTAFKKNIFFIWNCLSTSTSIISRLCQLSRDFYQSCIMQSHRENARSSELINPLFSNYSCIFAVIFIW